MGMSDVYGPADDAESIATIHAALDAGVTLLDTGDFYGMGHNELLLREALKGRDRDQVLLSVKFGALRGPDGSLRRLDGRPAAVKNFLAYTLRRLGTDYIDIYRLARLDPTVPIEETVGAIADLCRPATSATSACPRPAPRRSAAPTPSTRSPTCRSSTRCSRAASRRRSCRPAASSASASPPTACCRAACSAATGPADRDRGRRRLPRPPAALQRREPRAQPGAGRGAARGRRGQGGDGGAARDRVGAVAGEDIVPLVGARRRDRLAEALGALEVELTADDLAAIERAVPRGRGGGRPLPPPQMATLDSERSRGRPPDERTRPSPPTQILDAAEDVLRRFGPAKATVVDVARALGVSHGSVYRHFPSKAALRDAVAERWLARISAPLAGAAAEERPPSSACAAGSTSWSPPSAAGAR